MSKRLISFDLHADFGCLKKPDVNDGLMLTFNILHKPALLGILGAVVGLRGYERKGELPDYYQKLKDLPVGIEPLGHDKGNFTKTNIKYTNTVGYANSDGNLLIHEQTLIAPAYRIYLLLDLSNNVQQDLYNRLKANEAVYLPYIGKNEFSAWFTNFRDNHPVEMNVFNGERYEIKSIFSKSIVVKDSLADNDDDFTDIDVDFINSINPFIYFERLPLEFDKEPLLQYKLEKFSFTTGKMKPHVRLPNLFRIQQNEYVQLF
jgi:CRISPR-associated protein Cas5h